jgi:peptidoglycan/xylan/chitin deacetylase (PgdA/CDA1 family)
MTGRDHRIRAPNGPSRSPRTARTLATLAGGSAIGYLLPALSYHSPALRVALGVQTRTRSGRGYALTFDDGPHPQGTPAVLELLERHRVHATFFLVGEQVVRAPELAAEIVAAGHAVGLHCDRHRNLLRLGPRAVALDIARARARIEDASGRPVECYRPPYGIFNAAALAIARREGWRPVLWTHWGHDWQAKATADSITAELVGRGVPDGSVLLLHDADHYSAPGSWRQTVAALPRVLEVLAASELAATVDL